MNPKLPYTPFSTPLSRSARETKQRLENIMSGPKKRPPVIFIALVSAFCLLSGNLVSCQVAQPEGNAPAELENVSTGSTEDSTPRSVTYQLGEQPLSQVEQTLAENLFRAAEEEKDTPFQVPTVSLLASMEKDGWLMGVVFVEDHLENTLILGAMDKASGEMYFPTFQYSVHGGVPNVVTFRDYEGRDCVLLTLNGFMNGQYYGEAGMFVFNGPSLTRRWPSEDDSYRGSYLALLAPGGVDVYTVNPDFEWGKEEPWSMWQLETGETFYADPSGADQLPMPVYFDALRWLIDYTNDPGGWRIVSLTLDEGLSTEGMDCFTLQAREETGSDILFANLFFPYELNTAITRVYGNLDHAEAAELYHNLLDQRPEP